MEHYVTIDLSTGKAVSVNRKGFRKLDESKFYQYEISLACSDEDAMKRAEAVHTQLKAFR